jgi:alkanesulfonate monooxygenase SsuD/methylene tetrahydromethanopterin reductase-like flavin-dependent oxidoreductase (luciferase family)
MEFGLFLMPSHPPERSIHDGHEWDLQMLRWADQYGFLEAWIGEHHTEVWEPNPAPEILMAQAFRETRNIRIGAGAFLLPYHHPVALAHRIAFLDHISNGRLNVAVGAGALPLDRYMFGSDHDRNREMFDESLAILTKMFRTNEPFEHKGKYFSAARPPFKAGDIHGPHLRPLQSPHPPIAMASAGGKYSRTLHICGQYGYLPISFNLAPRFLVQNWKDVERGAQEGNRVARRDEWRIVREALVADTDGAAWKAAVGGMMGRVYSEYLLPLLLADKKPDGSVTAEFLSPDPTVPTHNITMEYLARTSWLIGSPKTVVRKIEKLYDEVGGFGAIEILAFDYSDDPDVWRRSLELIGTEVKPRVAHLTGNSLVPA